MVAANFAFFSFWQLNYAIGSCNNKVAAPSRSEGRGGVNKLIN